MDKDLLKVLREAVPDLIAKQITSVQPIPADAIKKMMEAAMPESDLIANGYEPISELKLVWRKKQ